MQLSGYQLVASDKLLEHETFADFDPPGAGKTAVAIDACRKFDEFPVLITVPAHLVQQWKLQLELWGVPSDEIAYTPRGTTKGKRITQLVADCPWNIVSYDMWTRDYYRDFFLSSHWSAYVMDESHRLRKGKPGKTGAWQGISWLRTKTRSKHLHTPVWWLSGTPIVKDATDVFPLLNMANRVRYGSRQDFALRTCRVSQTPYGLHVGPVIDVEKFHQTLGKYSIRRDWREIPELRDLQRRDIELPIELDPATLKRHRSIKRDYRDPLTDQPILSSAAMIHALRRLTLPTKVEAFNELLKDHPGRFLALVWYRDSGRLLYDHLRRNSDRPIAYIDGSTSESARTRAINVYRHHRDAVLVGTIGALSEGHNLQDGYNVAFVEQHYLSTANDQALRRVLRRGQTQPVLVFWLYCLRSYDLRVKRVADKREADIERALDEFLDQEEWE